MGAFTRWTNATYPEPPYTRPETVASDLMFQKPVLLILNLVFSDVAFEVYRFGTENQAKIDCLGL